MCKKWLKICFKFLLRILSHYVTLCHSRPFLYDGMSHGLSYQFQHVWIVALAKKLVSAWLESALVQIVSFSMAVIPTRRNIFLPVRLLVWADGRGTVAQADSAAWAKLKEAPEQKLLQLKNIQKYNWVKHREMLIC
jgi:hypothetical protein